jgi:uncharacterized damage-inducible protein DinB
LSAEKPVSTMRRTGIPAADGAPRVRAPWVRGAERMTPDAGPAPANAALTFREMLDWTAAETARWHGWLTAQPPAVLDLPHGTGRTATVRGLVHHVVAVERRYADRLLGGPVAEYHDVRADSVEALFAEAAEARARLERFLAGADEAALARRLTFETLTAGTFTASARKIVAHALLHGVRHWAQLATALRQAGHPTDWGHDLLLSDALA